MTYRIANWSRHFENNRTRELKRMEWVPVPNRMDGAGYTALVMHQNGAAHLGAWLAILEIASRRDKEERGMLPQEGAEIPQALARISRLPAELFIEVLPRLVKLGWIEQVGEIPHPPAEKSHPPAEKPPLNGREWKGMEGNGTEKELTVRAVADSFSDWLRPWPRCASPDSAARAWLSCVTGETMEQAFSARDRYLASDEVKRGAIMEPSKWLFAQKDAKWNGKWPIAASRESKSVQPDVAAQAKEIMRKRIENGRKPL